MGVVLHGIQRIQAMNYLITVAGHSSQFYFETEAEALAMAEKLTGWGDVSIWHKTTTLNHKETP